MRQKMQKLKLLMAILYWFILSGSISILWAQQGSDFNLAKNELKQVTSLLNELQYRRELNTLQEARLNEYESLAKENNTAITLLKQQIEIYKASMEQLSPAWYDRFWVGAGVTAIIMSGIIYLISGL